MKQQLRVVVFALACVLAAFGQNTGRLSGTVLDASGASIPGATVNLMLAGGTSPIQSVKSGQDGGFFFASLQPVNYDLSVEMSGFRKELIRGLKVDPGVELSMKPLNLEVSQQVETIEVTAENMGVQTANAEVASTITNSQVRRLPVLNRSPLGLISTQAGIGSNNRTPTTINGLRPSFTNITVDGINVQDNFIRSNALDYLPNLLLLDQVAEFTVSTSNTNAALGSGAAQVTFNTPSGSNELHGNAYWYNRNNIASANTWFNNKNGVSRPFLNQNQLGGSIGGPILKDKLFFYANYEALRLRQQSPQTRTILTSDARNGVFTYRDVNGAIQKSSVLQLSNSAFDSVTRGLIGQIPGFEQANRTDIGDGLNTAGYAFNQRDNRTRDNVTGKVDYVLSMRHSVSGTYLWNRDMDDRPDVAAEGYTVAPLPRGDNTTNLISAAWRYVPTGSFTNELRGGLNFAPGLFLTSQDFGNSVLGLPLVSNPVNTFRPQGRYTDTYNLADNATKIRGRHTIAFGAQYQRIHIENFSNFDVVPTYTLAMSQSNTKTLVSAQLPGVRSQDLGIANNLLALTGGFLSTGLQSFNVTSQTSGFVPGASNTRNLRMQNLAFYVNDTWRVNRRFTLTAGLRWEYWSPVSERDGIALLPVIQNGNVIQTLLNPDGTVDFPTGPWYGKDLNNFGPNIGFSWQPFSDDSRTVIRGGYSINYPNDDFMVSMNNNVLGGSNAGLAQNRSITNLVAPAASSIPTIAPPAYKVPRTYTENAALDPAGVAFAMPDPNLRTPYVQQWSFGVQREIAGGVVEGRYVGNHAVKQWRAFDYNQILIKGTPFLADFKRAQTNGLLAQGAGRGFDPRYNPAIPGSQPTPVFDSMPSGGLLTNGTIIGLIQTGEVAGLAHTYVTNRLNGPVQFYTNTNSYGTNVMSNYSGANYHSLQLDYRRTFRSGWQFQANYTMAKSLSDTTGDSQTRFEAFLDNDNAAVEYAPTTFDLRHAFKLNGVWELPIGKGRLVNVQNSVLNMIVGGWTVGGLMTWQSGSPFSVLSARNTLNRTGRSASNTATAIGSLDGVVGFYMTGNGPYMVSQSAIDPATGRGVAGDGRPTFAGQVFANPDAGSIGALQRRMFYGPNFWNTDLSVIKHFQITEKQRLEFRSEFFNLTNTPSFYIGDQNINSTTFGRITTAASGRRVIQFGLYYRF